MPPTTPTTGWPARLPPVPLIVQDAHQDDAARVRADLLRWYDEANTEASRVGE